MIIYPQSTADERRGVNEDELRGQLITRLREDHLWTREELAKRAGVTPTTVSLAEGGHTRVRLSTIGKLANALGVPATRLLRPTEEKELTPSGKDEAPREAGRRDTRTGDERLQDRLAPRVARLEELDLGELLKRRHELGEWLSELKRKVDYGAGSKEEITNDDAYFEITDELLALMTVLNKNASKQLSARDSDS